jgi:hypothetical protein
MHFTGIDRTSCDYPERAHEGMLTAMDVGAQGAGVTPRQRFRNYSRTLIAGR